jgi:hypothetical protein
MPLIQYCIPVPLLPAQPPSLLPQLPAALVAAWRALLLHAWHLPQLHHHQQQQQHQQRHRPQHLLQASRLHQQQPLLLLLHRRPAWVSLVQSQPRHLLLLLHHCPAWASLVQTHQPQLPPLLLLPHPRSAAQATQLPALLLLLLLAPHQRPSQALLLLLLGTLEVAGSHHPLLLVLLLLGRRVSHERLCNCRSHPDKPRSGLQVGSAQSRAEQQYNLVLMQRSVFNACITRKHPPACRLDQVHKAKYVGSVRACGTLPAQTKRCCCWHLPPQKHPSNAGSWPLAAQASSGPPTWLLTPCLQGTTRQYAHEQDHHMVSTGWQKLA